MEFALSPKENIAVYEPAGCRLCKFTGHLGRTAIYEILPVSEGIQRLILERASAHVIRSKAVEEGMVPLRQIGWKKIRQGLTTPDEVVRVTLQEGI
jgi:type II secretory ATPase GspE/PulE/Tfp pilus assembly ATPase PilB-like protein